MKKILIYTLVTVVFAFIFLMAVLFIKKDKSYTAEMEAVDFLKEIKAYTTDLDIEVKNSKEDVHYKGHQVYIKDLGYKLELKDGRTFIFRGDDIEVRNGEILEPYTIDKSFDEVYKYGFVGEYIGLIYTNEDMQFEKTVLDGDECIIITTLIPGNNDNLFRGSLFYDMKKHVPKKTVIYDSKDKERIIYTYDNFNWTDKIQDNDLEAQ